MVGVISEIRKYFSKDRFTGYVKEYKTTEAFRPMAHWGIWESLREFVQNAIDEMTPEVKDFGKVEKPKPDVDFGISSGVNGTYIWDKGRGVRILDILITGKTGKVELKPTRGEFGEGIKKAVQTLLSLGHKVTFYTRNGYKIEATKSFITAEGETYPVVGYIVKKYDAKGFSYGTVVEVEGVYGYKLADFTTLAPEYTRKIIEGTEVNLYLVKPEVYEKLPDKIKAKMRTNEIPSGWDGSEIKREIKSKYGEDAIVTCFTYNEIFDIENGPLAYRDILIRRAMESMYSYNLWKCAPINALGRDRKIMSDEWLFEEVGSIYRNLIMDYSWFYKGMKSYGVLSGKRNDKIFEKFIRNLISGIEMFEKHIYVRSLLSDDEKEYLEYIFKKVIKRPFIVVTEITAATRRNMIKLLEYEGYSVYTVPSNLLSFAQVTDFNKVAREKENREVRKRIIPDDRLTDEQSKILNILRWISNRLYSEYKARLFEIFEKYKSEAESQRDKHVSFIPEPPKIYAADLSAVSPPEFGTRTLGVTNMEKREIYIDISILNTVKMYLALGTLSHELAHYVTWLTDANMRALREAIEKIAGLIEMMLIAELGMVET